MAIGREVNLGSPKQLQDVLFEQLQLPKTRKTKTGYSTDAAVLADLQESSPHPFLDLLLQHREATKLRQIIESLDAAIGADGRIRTTYLQTGSQTGRLSSTEPNLQNIPIRTAESRRIRAAFEAGAGYETLLSDTDYDVQRMTHSVRRMVEYKVDGVAIMTSEMSSESLAELRRRKIPMVFLDTGKPGPLVGNVSIDYEQGVDLAIKHLTSLHHRRIALIQGPAELRSAVLRLIRPPSSLEEQ